MKRRSVISFITAIAAAVSIAGSSVIPAYAEGSLGTEAQTEQTEQPDTAADKQDRQDKQDEQNKPEVRTVEVAGCTIPADVTKACFITGNEGDAMTSIYLDYSPDYGENYYYCPSYISVDCEEIAEKLPKLKSLSILISDVKNLPALAELKSLRTLEIQVCSGTTDISFLKKMPKLTKLKYIDKECMDISAVAALKNLTSLTLSPSNRLSDLSVMKGMKKLTYLEADFGFESLKPLAKLTKLKSLRVNSNYLRDISTLSKLKRLTELEILEHNNIRSISVIGKLTKLKSLMLHTMELDSMAPLKKLKKLERLTIMYVRCPDARKTVSSLTTLKELSVSEAIGGDCTYLKKLTKLESLVILYDDITSLNGLQKLKKLKFLWIQNYNPITDLKPISGLTNLEVLYLSDSKITDISALKKLKKLKVLYIQNNNIEDYSVILGLDKLELLWTDGLPADLLEEFKKTHPDCVIY